MSIFNIGYHPLMNEDNNYIPEKGLLFNTKGKVSVWASQYPYADIPDDYFEETFSKKGSRAKNSWSDNYKIRYFDPKQMETNGAHTGTIDMHEAAGGCSCSSSYIVNLMSKAKKK
jgi:hypothetical protein